MSKSYNGKVIWIDLSTEKIETIELPEEMYKEYLGGFGLGIRLIFDRQPAGADPLGEDNVLGFMPGLLSGTETLFSGRYMLVGKSPATGGWTESNSGGFFSRELKRSGFDGVFFRGISKKPVYLWLHHGKAELRPADHLWGKDAVETENIIRQELDDDKIRIACIGPAGENLSRISGVVNDSGRVAARGGLGAVMGSKRLKAVVARGTEKIESFDKEQIIKYNKEYLNGREAPPWMSDRIMSRITLWMAPFNRLIFSASHVTGIGYVLKYITGLFQIPIIHLNTKIMRALCRTAGWDFLKKYGTSGFTVLCGEIGDTPVKNWKGSIGRDFSSRDLRRLSNERVTSRTKKNFHCDKCPLGCGGIVDIPEGEYKGHEAHQPEYETLAAFGPLCLNNDLNSIYNLSEYCNRAGIDTISAGSVIAFAIECFEDGLLTLEDTDGLELKWGDSKSMFELLKRIVKREGIGDLLADGVKEAAKRIGKDSEKKAMHVGGQELPMHHPLAIPSLALTYTAEPAMGRHTGSMVPYGMFMNLPDIYPEYYDGPVIMFSKKKEYELMVRRQAVSSYYLQTISSAGLCLSGIMMGGAPVREWINAATGWNLSDKEVLDAGRRGLVLKQVFNWREGLRIREIKLPERVTFRAIYKGGALAGKRVNVERMRKAYCELQDWDLESGKPNRQVLEELNLYDLVGDI